jgi:hypothetical protein
MNMLISQKLWSDLDSLFKKRLLLSLETYLLIIVGLFSFLILFGNFWIIPKITIRFLPIKSLNILIACYFLQLIINAWALYLRGHNKEPYMITSIISAVWIAAVTWLAGKIMSPAWFFLGFITSYVWNTPVAYIMYRKYKEKWHGRY